MDIRKGNRSGQGVGMRHMEKGKKNNAGCKADGRGCRKKFWKRAGTVLLAAILAMPVQAQAQGNLHILEKAQGNAVSKLLVKAREAYAQDGAKAAGDRIRVEKELYHVHIGNAEDGTGCYIKDILHIHEGNPGKGGACYEEPIDHEHTGNETEGGGCYGKKNYHVHEGNETEGGACYGEKIYHSHTGDEVQGGGCYGKKVCHTHVGSASLGGGCYGKEVKHEHVGNAVSGGGCYGKEVRHSHAGSGSSGGGCYTEPVYHTHAGDSVSGGKCYAPVYHTHKDECYGTAECTVVYESGMKMTGKQDADCPLHGLTEHITFEGVFSHKNCDKGKVTETRTMCGICRDMGYVHEYPKAVCGMEEAIEEYTLLCGKDPETTVDSWETGCNLAEGAIVGYEINCGKDAGAVESYEINCGKEETDADTYETDCGKTEETVESYRQNCGKTEETVDSYNRNCGKGEDYVDAYALSCQKTEGSVDGHELGCGKEEGIPYAVFSLSMDGLEWSSEPVVLQAVCEDRDGFIRFAANPFLWEGQYTGEDEDGSSIGYGSTENSQGGYTSRCSVTENGIYTVRLMIENEDIDDQEPDLSIAVGNIDKTAPKICGIVYETEQEAAEIEIRVAAEDVQPDGTRGSGLAPEAYSFDGGQTWVEENGYKVRENGTIEIAVRDVCGNIAKESVQISNIRDESRTDNGNGGNEGAGPDKEEGSGSGREEGDGQGNEEDDPQKGDRKEDEEKDKAENGIGKEEGSGQDSIIEGKDDTGQENSSALEERGEEENNEILAIPIEPIKKLRNEEGTRAGGNQPEKGESSASRAEGVIENSEEIKSEETAQTEGKAVKLPTEKEEITIRQREVNAGHVSRMPAEMVKKADVIVPIVKAVTFTMGSVAAAAALLYLLYLMLRGIKIYHLDGEGNSHYAGSCVMKKRENGFEVKMPDMIIEQSATGQFLLKPGNMFASNHKGEELMILAGNRKEAVWIDKEIPLKLVTFA